MASTTRTATSTLFNTCFALRTRSSPRCPSSSIPGVSMITTGPIGSSSMALLTGSVVVPFTSDTTASSCPVTLFTILDFPAFLLPKKPICTRSADGVSFIPIIYPLFFQHQTGPHPFLFLSTCFFLIFQKPDIPSTLIS